MQSGFIRSIPDIIATDSDANYKHPLKPSPQILAVPYDCEFDVE
jgi:hypothetical protein